MFVPSNAIAVGSLPRAKVPRVAPVGGSLVALRPPLTTHMFVPSNAISVGSPLRGKVPTGPHVGGLLQAGRALLQAPAARDATGARGAMQSWTDGGQTLQGPVAQSLSSLH